MQFGGLYWSYLVVAVRCGCCTFLLHSLRSSTTDRLAGHDHLVSVSMFDYKPQRCPFGHKLWPGMAQVGWKPCICTVARGSRRTPPGSRGHAGEGLGTAGGTFRSGEAAGMTDHSRNLLLVSGD